MDQVSSTFHSKGQLITVKSLSATDTDGDFAPLMESLSFISGSPDGATVCANVTVVSDGMVECEEEFTVELTFVSSKDNLNLENFSTVVTLVDSDGIIKMWPLMKVTPKIFPQPHPFQYQLWLRLQKVTHH